jgi:hypothetical protein
MRCVPKTLAAMIVCAVSASLFSAHAQTAPEKSTANKPELIFQNGFEGTSEVVPAQSGSKLLGGAFATERIIGKDTTLNEKSDWLEDLDNNPAAGRFFIEYTGGSADQRYAKVVPEPGNPSNKVLKFWLREGWSADSGIQKARVQTSLYGIKEGYKEFFTQVRMYVHPDFKYLEHYPKEIHWLTIGEYWNNEWWDKKEKYGFRITLGIGKNSADKEPLHFIVNGENAGQKEVWAGDNTKTLVPLGKWFLLETYFKEGDKDNGRFYVAITPDGGAREVVFDIRNYTHNTYDPAPNGMTGFNPMKLYTWPQIAEFVRDRSKQDGLVVYWDDFKLFKNKRPD